MDSNLTFAALKRLLDDLTRPSDEVQVVEERQHAQTLATMTLSLLVASLIIAPIWIVTAPDFKATPLISVCLVIALAFAYRRSRTRRYAQAGAALGLTIFALVLSSLLLATGPITERMLALPFLSLVGPLTTYFLSPRITPVIIGINMGVILTFFWIPEAPFPFIFANLVFFVLLTTLGSINSMVGRRYRRHALDSEYRYRTLVDNLSEGVILLMRDGTISAANTAAERILGVNVEQMMGRASGDPAWQAIHEDGTPFPEEEHPAIVALRTGQPSVGVIMGVLTSKRQRRWISINARPLIRGNDPRPYAAVTSFTDVTEARERERALREAEHRYHALFDQSHDAVFILSLEGRHLEANRPATEVSGYSAEEIQKLGVYDLSAEPAKSAAVHDRLLSGERLPTYERLFRKKDGTVVPVEINVELVRDIDGRPLHIQSIVRDISDRKRVEKAFRESEFRHRALLSGIPDLVFRIHRDGTCLDLHANDSGELMTPPDQLVGRNMSELLPPERLVRFQESVERAVETGREYSYEYSLPIGGEIRDFEGRIVMSAADEVLLIARNITERKRAQQHEFELALEKERLVLLRQFVEKASHEFRTPLTLINSAAYAITHYDDPTRRLTREAQINQQVTRITRLLDMMLLMTRLKSGAIQTLVPVDVGMIVELACQQMIALQDERPQVHLELPRTLPAVLGSHADLVEALKQVLENAMTFTPVDGLVRVSARTDGQEVWIEVRDTGPGIAQEHLPHIFTSFWRQDQAHSTPGIGLGLPIARSIVEMHGGRIEVETEVGVGSAFRIMLPVLSEGKPQPPAASLNGRSAARP